MRTLSGLDQTVLKLITVSDRTRKIPTWLVYVLVTTAIVLDYMARIWFLGGIPKEVPKLAFLPFYPIIVLSAMFFGRYTGIYATVLSAFVAAATEGPMPNSLALRIDLVPTLAFIAVGFLMATIIESLAHLYDRFRVVAERSDILVRDLNHRVKNHLTAIAALVHLSKGKSDANGQEVLDTVASRLTVLARLYDRLHLDSDNASVRIDVHDFLSSICNDLASVSPALHIDCDLEQMEITADKGVPLGLLVNELVTNSVKHAFPNGTGTVRVTFRPNGEGYVLQVEDNGVGGQLGIAGTGTRLIQSLSRQLEGKLETTINNGRCSTITFPKSLLAA